MQTKYIQSKDFLDRGAKLIAEEDYLGAISALDDGILILGDAYYFDDLIDDSGMKLTLAAIEQKHGANNVAAHLKLGVLTSRLDVYLNRPVCRH